MDYLLNFIGSLFLAFGITLVLNLIINGLPSKQKSLNDMLDANKVLNLIINGLPSKL